MARFKLAKGSRKRTVFPKAVKDEAGTVTVMIWLAEPTMPSGTFRVKGNLMRSLRIGTARVSEVYDAIKGMCDEGDG
jgi:hypothetical protein